LRNADGELTGAAATVVGEIQARIRARFPDATFNVRIGPDGRVYLAAYTEARHDFEVQDLASDRTVDALIGGEVKVHVFPRQLPPPAPGATPPSRR